MSIVAPRPAVPTGRRGGPALAHRPLVLASVVVPVAALAALLAVQLLVPAGVATAAPWLAVVGIALGVPHGAVDHMVPFWVDGSRATPRRLAAVLASYLAVAAAATAALLLAPTAAVLAFLLVSALHFGRGEVVHMAERAGRPPPHGPGAAVVALAHGAAVVALPYALWHDQARAVLEPLAPALVDPPRWVLGTLAAAVAGLLVAAAAVLLRGGHGFAVAELALVAAVVVVVPPLAAFGVYFGAWHALRHTARLVELAAERAPAGATRPLRWALGTYVRHAAAPTAVALAAMVALWSARGTPAVAAGIAVLLALTFPHVRTVAALDRVRGARPAG